MAYNEKANEALTDALERAQQKNAHSQGRYCYYCCLRWYWIAECALPGTCRSTYRMLVGVTCLMTTWWNTAICGIIKKGISSRMAGDQRLALPLILGVGRHALLTRLFCWSPGPGYGSWQPDRSGIMLLSSTNSGSYGIKIQGRVESVRAMGVIGAGFALQIPAQVC